LTIPRIWINFTAIVPPVLPNQLLSSLEGLPGFDAAAFAAVHAAGAAPTSIRINPAKPPAKMPANPTPVPWSTYGYYLDTRPSFTFDPLFHAGTYYVQEASSMFLGQALMQTVDLATAQRALDCCAAPGGKSTLLQSLLSPDSLLISNEVIKSRVSILQENMIKWGAANTIVTNNDPRDFQRLENYFDLIVVDAPCSGSGLFRREPDAIEEWSAANVALCWQRQQRILADCWPALRQDGTLIYSTCSYSREEDEDVLDWMMTEFHASSCRLRIQPEWNIMESTSKLGAYGYRFYPDRLQGEGFFIAVVRKKDGGSFTPPRRLSQPEKPKKNDLETIRHWITSPIPLGFFTHQDHIHALPEPRLTDLAILQSSLYLKEAGISLGQVTAKDFIPHHHLAMSTIIDPGIPVQSVDREQALHYLRKDELRPDTTRRGWTRVQYEDRNLGWIKILPQRANNYYPKEWRILKRE
jgi:16S rRNA C967 or C1407 C5-methylase (RsmB/RsmF family)/NOL1/NOP2/fmu family ribosome biogenesis protein